MDLKEIRYIKSFNQVISIVPLQVHYYSEALQHSMDTVSKFHSEASQASVSEGLAQGPYVAARAGFEPTTNLPMSYHTPHGGSLSASQCLIACPS